MQAFRYKLIPPFRYSLEQYPWNPAPRTHSTDHVCNTCYADPEVRNTYGADCERTILSREEKAHCTLCGVSNQEEA